MSGDAAAMMRTRALKRIAISRDGRAAGLRIKRLSPAWEAELLAYAASIPDEDILDWRDTGPAILGWIRAHQPTVVERSESERPNTVAPSSTFAEVIKRTGWRVDVFWNGAGGWFTARLVSLCDRDGRRAYAGGYLVPFGDPIGTSGDTPEQALSALSEAVLEWAWPLAHDDQRAAGPRLPELPPGTSTLRRGGRESIVSDIDIAAIEARHREQEAYAAGRLAGYEEGLNATETERDGAYRERNAVVAALFRVGGYEVSVMPAPDADGWWIVYAKTPQGQVSWHVSPVDIRLFDGFPRRDAEWDGHTTDEKYERLAALASTEEPPDFGLQEITRGVKE